AQEEVEEEVMHRAETPQLKGLKILGKIDTSKLDASTKPKKTEKPQQAASGNTPKTTTGDSGADGENRKKRKRKKLPTPVNQGNMSGQGKGKQAPKEEVKEVSQKEIDDKIKATMAKLATSGKNKRQKIRRDTREVKREKQEMRNTEEVDGKLKLTEFVSVSELAGLLDVPVTQVITTCMNLGVIVSINQRLDA